MKKLMIMLAAVAMAAGVQAAALSWTTWAFTNDGSADSDWITGGQAYLVMVTDSANFAVSDSLAVTGGSIVDSIAFDAGTASGGWNDTADLVAGNKYLFAVIATTDGSGLAVPTSGSYGVDANGDNGTAFYEVTWDASTGGSFIAADSFAGASMTTAVVPAPTSGLLLLLGVGALALKRRSA